MTPSRIPLAPGARPPTTLARLAGTEPRTYGERLRYIGRDYATGRPTGVDDAFIAQVERDVERYGKDETEPIPPPPAGEVDVARLALPTLGVDAAVRRYGVDKYGRLDVPQDTETVGWNPGYCALPGTGGSTFMAAHFEYRGAPGVFARLASLRAGAAAVVALTAGASVVYRVTSVVDYALGAIDMGALLAGREGLESLTLMTCSGPSNEGNYAFRTVALCTRET